MNRFQIDFYATKSVFMLSERLKPQHVLLCTSVTGWRAVVQNSLMEGWPSVPAAWADAVLCNVMVGKKVVGGCRVAARLLPFLAGKRGQRWSWGSSGRPLNHGVTWGMGCAQAAGKASKKGGAARQGILAVASRWLGSFSLWFNQPYGVLKPMGSAHMKIFFLFFFFWNCFAGVYDLTAVMSHCIKVAARKGEKKCIYGMLNVVDWCCIWQHK